MGFFSDNDGGGNELVDFMDQAPKVALRGFGFILKCLKPTIRDIQTIRDRAALQRAAAQMEQQVQSPGSPQQTPASMPPVIAAPDLSPPPTRKSMG